MISNFSKLYLKSSCGKYTTEHSKKLTQQLQQVENYYQLQQCTVLVDHHCEFANATSQVPVQVFQEIGVVEGNSLGDLMNPENSAKLTPQFNWRANKSWTMFQVLWV